ncbi:inositol monophosphatase [Photobacterium sp. ZSDE20]|uniref:Inositol monophosphatase n=1 Tax=Photobacterium pectinilyticum TaxID=2906793 RepID=A0ABT1N804_9GAMM|nr:inositol monophosphatase [Photobacterium sp. ZSDE20]MCQ1060890.1 inositol monophosphatase [Photobacterium sp. ZSDE20]MDD1828714.1 inositol monophosphatase [Photobacterium sp. ZSDE20]
MTLKKIDQVIDVIRHASRDIIQSRFRQIGENEIAVKTSSTDLVTECDTQVEQALTEGLQPLFPDYVILGEEMVSQQGWDSGVINRLDKVVIIDPIDGTYNFAHGISQCGVMVAVREGNETQLSVLYDPLQDDWVWAIKGQGCFWENKLGASKRLRIPSRDANLGQISPFLFDAQQRGPILELMAGYDRVLSVGCSCHEYRNVLFGGATFYLTQRAIKPWDHYAGLLAIEEAGGYAAYLDGQPVDKVEAGRNLLVANSEQKWQDLAVKMNEKLLIGLEA